MSFSSSLRSSLSCSVLFHFGTPLVSSYIGRQVLLSVHPSIHPSISLPVYPPTCPSLNVTLLSLNLSLKAAKSKPKSSFTQRLAPSLFRSLSPSFFCSRNVPPSLPSTHERKRKQREGKERKGKSSCVHTTVRGFAKRKLQLIIFCVLAGQVTQEQLLILRKE